MTYIYKGPGLLCPCAQITKWFLTLLIMRMHATNRRSVFLAPSKDKSNLLWLLAETPLRLEPLSIYGMQMHHLQSILRREKVIGRPCVLPSNWSDLYQLLLSMQ